MTSEPTTAAGRALVLIAQQQSVNLGHLPDSLPVIVARIEAEARQQDTSALALLRDTLDLFDQPLGKSRVELADRIRKYLAALPPSAPAGLDVERLERALFGVRFNPLRDSSMEWAERIAAEYEKLGR